MPLWRKMVNLGTAVFLALTNTNRVKMKLNDIHFCFGYVLGKRDKFFKEFILNLKDKFTEPEYTRQEIQRILYENEPMYVFKMGCLTKSSYKNLRCFRFIKHTIRSHKNY